MSIGVFVLSYNCFAFPVRPCRPGLFADRTVNRIFLGPPQRQALRHITRQSLPYGCGARKGHVGGGGIHFQLQLIPDDS